jgi:hypothetical protein
MKFINLPVRACAISVLLFSSFACSGGGGGGGGGPTAPASPGALVVIGVTDSSITIGWLDNSSDETGFRVERSEASGLFTTVGSVVVDEVRFADVGLSPATQYSYRVVSTGDREGPPSNVVTVTTAAPAVVISSITPDSGFVDVEQDVRIIGDNFGGAGTNAVRVGGVSAIKVDAVTQNVLLATFPASGIAGSVPVAVDAPNGVATLADAFTYFPYPVAVAAADQRQVSAIVNNAENIRCAVDGDNVYAVWEDNPDGQKDIYCNRSLDGGETWLGAVRLDRNPAGLSRSDEPRIYAEGGRVCVIWRDWRNSFAGSFNIYCNRSVDSGATWLENDVQINVAGQTSFPPSPPPTLSGNGENLVVGYCDTTGSINQCYVNHSTDGGATWAATDVPLGQSATTTVFPKSPQFARAGNRIYAVWSDSRNGNEDVFVARSSDGGASWGLQQRVDHDAGGAFAREPVIAAYGTDISVAWHDFRNFQNVYYNRSTDGGVTWGAVDVRVNLSGDPGPPRLAVADDGRIHVAWRIQYFADTDNITHALSSDGGVTFRNETRLNPQEGDPEPPRLFVSQKIVVVGWNAFQTSNQFACNVSRDGGETWQPDQTTVATAGTTADLAIDGARVFFTWTNSSAEFSRNRAN